MASSLSENIETLASLLKAKKLRVATAESCTGGGIAKALTDVAGSSDWFECGFVTYSNDSKQVMLGVNAKTLEEQGAVSEAVVSEMARGATKHSNAQLAVAVSGIAGPTGGSLEKPVGTVWIAWLMGEQVRATCSPVGTVWIAWLMGEQVRATCFRFQGDREAVRYQAIEAAVCGLIEAAERV